VLLIAANYSHLNIAASYIVSPGICAHVLYILNKFDYSTIKWQPNF